MVISPTFSAVGVTASLDPSARSSGRAVDDRTLWLLIALGAALRIAALFAYGLQPLRTESAKVAAALAITGQFADAFGAGTGPTAHVGPLVPLPLAGFYWVFGARTFAAELSAALLSIGAVMLSILLYACCAEELGIARRVRLLGVAVVSLVPLQLYLEAIELRVWEASYAAAGLGGVMLAALRLDRADSIRLKLLLPLGAGVALLQLLSPAAGIAGAGCLAILLLRRAPISKAVLVIGVAAVAHSTVHIGWSARNERLLGSGAGFRTGLGLALSIGNYQGALTKPTPQAAYVDRMREVHPHHGEDGQRLGAAFYRMQAAGGEVSYNQLLKDEAVQWIKAHPLDATRLWTRNLKNFYLPPAWLWHRWEKEPRKSDVLRSLLVSTLALTGLLFIAVMLVRRRWSFIYPAVGLALAALPYVPTFTLLRYRYPVSTLLILLGVAGIAQLVKVLLSRRSGESEPTVALTSTAAGTAPKNSPRDLSGRVV